MQGGTSGVALYAIAIDPRQPILVGLSADCAQAAQVAAREMLAELSTEAAGA
jgi:hypothetical protein